MFEPKTMGYEVIWWQKKKKRTKVKDTDSTAPFELISVFRKIIDRNMK